MSQNEEEEFEFRLRLEQEQAQSASQTDDYLGDAGKNALKSVTDFGDSMNIAKGVKDVKAKLDAGYSPEDLPDPLTEWGNAAKGVGRQVWQGAKDLGNFGMGAVQAATGKPWSQTQGGKNFRERPIGSTVGAISTAIPLFKGLRMGTGAARSAFAGAEPNFLERIGGRGVNNSLGIQPDTMEGMTPRGGNPGKVGTDFGLKLHDEGLSGKNPVEALDTIQKKRSIFGEDVKQRVSDIKAQNSRFGEYSELPDALKQNSNQILKPLIDKANSLDGSYDAMDKFRGSHYRGVYDELAQASNENGGYTTLDDVRGQMQKIGNKLNNTNPLNDRFPVLRSIYRDLTQIQDQMVSDVANLSDRPELKQGLLDANANYSRMARIEPDVFHASSKAGVGKKSALSGDIKTSIFKSAEPTISEYAIKAGRGLRATAKFADETTAIPGKAASSLFNKIEQVAGDKRGSFFPEPPLRDMSAAEQGYGNFKNAYNRHAANYDWENVLKDKWGMHRNTGGNEPMGRKAVMSEYVDRLIQNRRN